MLAAAVVFAWQWLTQLNAVEALEGKVAALEGQLDEARAEIAGWESHAEAVQGAVTKTTAGIAAQLSALQALVDAGPGGELAPVAAEPAPAAPAAALAAEASAPPATARPQVAPESVVQPLDEGRVSLELGAE